MSCNLQIDIAMKEDKRKVKVGAGIKTNGRMLLMADGTYTQYS